MSATLSDARVDHATTGLAGASQLTHFAAFRTVACYVSEIPEASQLEPLGFREGEEGANLWLVLPRDEGVFHGMRVVEKVHCVHPVQI